MASYTLITGASDGLGAEFARQYAAKGRNLILVARSEDKLDALKHELSSVDVKVIAADLAKPGISEEIFKQCEGLTVSTLVNNAGQAMGGAWEGHSVDRLRFLINLNIATVVELSSLFLPQLKAWAQQHGRKNKEGGLLNVSSSSAFQAIPWMAAYSASKAYVCHLTEAIHDEMRERCPELRVTALCPGPVSTPIWTKNGANAESVRVGMMSTEAVVRDGIRGLERGQSIVLPGWTNWAGSFGNSFAPRWLVRRLSAIAMGQTHKGENELTQEEKKQYGI